MLDEKKCLICGLPKLPYPIKTIVGKQEVIMTVYYCPNRCNSLSQVGQSPVR